MFVVLGILVFAYVAYAAYAGEVYAKSRLWGSTISREQSPAYFWIVVGIYTLLVLALVTIF